MRKLGSAAAGNPPCDIIYYEMGRVRPRRKSHHLRQIFHKNAEQAVLGIFCEFQETFCLTTNPSCNAKKLAGFFWF